MDVYKEGVSSWIIVPSAKGEMGIWYIFLDLILPFNLN